MFEPGTRPGELRLTGVLHARGRHGSPQVVWGHEGDAAQIGRALWRAFRRLESQFSAADWPHSFPSKIVAGLARRR